MNVVPGDLVEFYSSFEPFVRPYKDRNPGIVLNVNPNGWWKGTQVSALVMWGNSDITTEHASYLRNPTKESK